MPTSTSKERILVVDDAQATVEVLQRTLSAEGFEVFTAAGVAEAIASLERTPVDLVITDVKMPRHTGLDLLRHVRANLDDTEVIMMTGYPSVPGAVEAVKTGAEEYLAKPFTDEELLAAVESALEKLRVRRLGQGRTPPLVQGPPGMLGESPAMQEVYRLIPRAAAVAAPVLITGESGTGKELVARAIHYGSGRASAPFVPVNCGGIPETLLESELFGFVKGSFTGATESRVGFFQAADGGTLFLDEVSEMSLAMQVKLLRVLQDQEVYMIGATRPRRVDARIIAATNRELREVTTKGRFREDLYFRLNVIPIRMPPLRDRGDDVVMLIGQFAEKYAQESGRPVPRFSERALEMLRSYHWPGNVRELQNVVQRLVIMCDRAEIDEPDLPSLMRFSVPHRPALDRTLAEVEAENIRQVVAHVEGNKSQAARILGIDRKTLRDKLKSLDSPDAADDE